MVELFDVLGGRLHRKIGSLGIPNFGIVLLHVFVGVTNFFSCGAIGTVVYITTKDDYDDGVTGTKYTKLPEEEKPLGVDVYNSNVKDPRRVKTEKKEVREDVPTPPEVPSITEILLPKQMEKVDHILRELLTTERSYVDDLRKLEYFFIRPITKSHPPILKGNSSLHSCFKKLVNITKMNEMFLKDMEKLVSLERSNVARIQDMCRVIITFSQPFKLYVEYISDYESFESDMVKSLRKNKRFIQVCTIGKEELKARNSRINELQSFTITPIQRIPRILLMMKELGKYVLDGTKEYPLFIEAMNIISETATYCNKKTKEIKNLRKLRSIETKYQLKGHIQPHTKILQEGEVLRVRRSGKPLKSSIIIMNDILVCSPLKKPKDLTWFKKPYVVKLNDRFNTKFEKKDDNDLTVQHLRGGKKKKKPKRLWLRFEHKNERDVYFDSLIQATANSSTSSSENHNEEAKLVTEDFEDSEDEDEED